MRTRLPHRSVGETGERIWTKLALLCAVRQAAADRLSHLRNGRGPVSVGRVPGAGRARAAQPRRGRPSRRNRTEPAVEILLVCPQCDEAFAPRFYRHCPQCGHDEGTRHRRATVEHVEPLSNGAAGHLRMIAVVAAIVLYFRWLFPR